MPFSVCKLYVATVHNILTFHFYTHTQTKMLHKMFVCLQRKLQMT